MSVPELYEVGRTGSLFGLPRFILYMMDGIMQVRRRSKPARSGSELTLLASM